MAAKFELKKTSNDKFVFNLLASNGQVILTQRDLRLARQCPAGHRIRRKTRA